jgi:hypothetical protein
VTKIAHFGWRVRISIDICIRLNSNRVGVKILKKRKVRGPAMWSKGEGERGHMVETWMESQREGRGRVGGVREGGRGE